MKSIDSFQHSVGSELGTISYSNCSVTNNCTVKFENGNKMFTYQGWGKANDDAPIDFIFTDKSRKIRNFKVHDEKMDNTFVSDHFMITAEIEI